MRRVLILSLAAVLAATSTVAAQGNPREQMVREDRKKVEADGFWIYGDLERGFAEAKKTGRPLVVILRCIPCEQCVKLDDDLVNKDPRVRPLLEKFVRVRIVSTNGLDLSLFQYDYDQSFACFLLNADGTIYGRYGTRSHRTLWADDVSLEGLAKALQGALDLHAEYPKSKSQLAGKTGPAPDFASPEKLPMLKDRYKSTLNYEGQVVQSCIHCHMVGEAQRQVYRAAGNSIPEQLLFPHPHPKALGLILDPRERATVLRAEPKSPAAQAGFEKGDVILRLEGQPLLSIADVQWVLHRAAPDGAALKAEVRRGERTLELSWTLPRGWRQRDDLSWRASTWALRRMAAGGMIVEDLPAADRKKAGLFEAEMGLRVRFLGNNGPHGAAYRAGVRQGDVMISFDERTDLLRETDVLAYALTHHKIGDELALTVLRNAKKVKVMLPMQE
jgi:hypothetical protein